MNGKYIIWRLTIVISNAKPVDLGDVAGDNQPVMFRK